VYAYEIRDMPRTSKIEGVGSVLASGKTAEDHSSKMGGREEAVSGPLVRTR